MNEKLQALSNDITKIFDLRRQKKEIEAALSPLESKVKKEFAAENVLDQDIGAYTVHIKKMPETRVVDTEKLKAAGLFEQYSKLRKGSESVMVTERKFVPEAPAETFEKVFG